MAAVRVRVELESTGGNTTGFEIPAEVVDALGGGGRPKVTVTVDGHTFQTSIARMGGRYLLGVSAARRAEFGLAAGDTVDLDITLDTAPREVEVPADLAAALAGDPAAETFWQTLSPSAKKWHTAQVTGAKTAETRARRVARSVELLAAGRAR